MTNISGGPRGPHEGGRTIESGRALAMAVSLVIAGASCADVQDGTRGQIHNDLSQQAVPTAQASNEGTPEGNLNLAPEDITLSTQVSLSPAGYVMTVWSNVSGSFTVQWLTAPNGQGIATETRNLQAGSQNWPVPYMAGYVMVVDEASGQTVHATSVP